jgi:hypothetical protein
MTATACPLDGDAMVPTCGMAPLGRLRWVLAELAAMCHGLRAGNTTR